VPLETVRFVQAACILRASRRSAWGGAGARTRPSLRDGFDLAIVAAVRVGRLRTVNGQLVSGGDGQVRGGHVFQRFAGTSSKDPRDGARSATSSDVGCRVIREWGWGPASKKEEIREERRAHR